MNNSDATGFDIKGLRQYYLSNLNFQILQASKTSVLEAAFYLLLINRDGGTRL